MPIPDFSKQTIDNLARRAGFQCSNPDCGVQTVGPSSEPEKAMTIGEAAHIFGAKPGSLRYKAAMSDETRAKIANGIWLCRNCHAKIDRDGEAYGAELLVSWRKKHEDRVSRELGALGARMRDKPEISKFEFLANYPQAIQRLAIDMPDGWEWSLAAALSRHLNEAEFKRLRNIRNGHYYKPHPQIRRDDFIEWVIERTHIMGNLFPPLVQLFNRLTASFGKSGEAGDAEEIHDVCVLMHRMLVQMIDHEEAIRFPGIPDEGEEMRSILVDMIGANAEKLRELPDRLEEIVALAKDRKLRGDASPKKIEWEVVFDVPEGFEERFATALNRYVGHILL